VLPSRRLAALLAVFGAAGAFCASALAAGPTNDTLPTITGRPGVGETLTADHGTWTPAPTGYAYQWQRCDADGGNCLDIVGATGQTRVVSAGDGQSTLDVVVTATTAGGSTDAVSDPFGLVGLVGQLTLLTPHFKVHYNSDPLLDATITETQAGDLGAYAERAYAAELADGYAAPLSDGTRGGDSRIDLYVVSGGSSGWLAYAQPDNMAAAQSAGYIVVNADYGAQALTQFVVAHELFHLVGFGIWLTPKISDRWLDEAAAEWMGFRVDGYSSTRLDVGSWDIALDCRDPTGTFQCDLNDALKNNGYARWPFFEFLTERYGNDFVKTIYAQGAVGGVSAITAVGNAIAAKNSTLGDVFNDWAVANMTGGYTVPLLQGLVPPTYTSIAAGTLASLNAKTPKGAAPVTSGPVPTASVAVNHLSTRYVAITHGSSAADGPCYKASLALTIALPSGVPAKPYFWWSQLKPDGSKESAQAFTVSGSTASLTLPWDTCDWGASKGYVSLPNPSIDVNAADFKISGTLTVDRSQEATATPPPDPVKVSGQVVDAGSGDVPRIQVFGPQLIQLGATSRQLRVIVQASDGGSLKATLGSLALASAKLRAGSNDVRFALPASALRALRSTSTASNALTLTPVSSGGAAGKAVLRKVVLERVAAPRHKAAKAAKAKPVVIKPRAKAKTS
jgi:hypothetical protein